MAHPRSRLLHRSPFALTALLVALAASGCGDSSGVGKTVPVAGQITLDNTPLTVATTVVLFKPDAAKGNASPWDPTGTVDGQGNYTLSTKGKRGAPPGWYKVIVTAFKAQADEGKRPRTQLPTPKSLVPARYGQAATTPLMIEVVENPSPDAYNLKLTGG